MTDRFISGTNEGGDMETHLEHNTLSISITVNSFRRILMLYEESRVIKTTRLLYYKKVSTFCPFFPSAAYKIIRALLLVSQV